MADARSPLWRIWVFMLLFGLIFANDDVMSTLEEMQRRQHDYYYQPRYEDAATIRRYSPDIDIEEFDEDDNYKRNPEMENLILQYLEENPINKRMSSYFRERANGNKRENYYEDYLNKIDEAQQEEEDIEELCQKYRLSFPELSAEISRLCGPEEKRSFSEYYPTNLGWDSIGMKKRFTYYPYNKRTYTKKFPVITKRSSNYYSIPFRQNNNKKRSPTSAAIKTDPKVEKDLSTIFTPKDANKKPPATKKPIIISPKAATKEPVVVNKANGNNTKDDKMKNNDKDKKEQEPLQIQKKSIRWSDYFGLDRRKKSDDLDNEWLLERYHKAIAMATKKRSSPEEINSNKKDAKDIDEKLKSIEEAIVDDTLKYTGAHEDVEDPKEVQEVKNTIISRLVAAYNLEKMRRALQEYRTNVLKQEKPTYANNEEKRVSVPRKSAVDEEREKTGEDVDNSIKCTQGQENCDEQNYRTPSQVLKETTLEFGSEECPKVQRACNEAASVLGTNGRVFEEACNIHQMCLLCGDNSWFAPTRQCNILFLAKADELCEGDTECQKLARHSVRYLVDVNKTLRNEPYSHCELACPDKRR